ncbi:MAG: hypothetical protein ABI435_01335 [Pseudolysinimonas sp.]
MVEQRPGVNLDFSAFPPLAALLEGAHSLILGLAALLEPVAGGAAAAIGS